MNQLSKQSWKNHKLDAPVEAAIYRDTVELHEELAQQTLSTAIKLQQKIVIIEEIISRAENALYRMASGQEMEK